MKKVFLILWLKKKAALTLLHLLLKNKINSKRNHQIKMEKANKIEVSQGK
jgi:hypothetical protein